MIIIYLISCYAIGKPTECEYPPTPECVDDRVWNGDESYCFIPYNYSCDIAPIDDIFYIDIDSFEISNTNMTEDEIINSIEQAATEWTASGANFNIVHEKIYETSINIVNTIAMIDDYNSENFYALADWQGMHNVGITKCDIYVYSKAFTMESNSPEYIEWSISNNTNEMSDNQVSFPSLMMHEFGHCLGFDDNELPLSTMNGEIYQKDVRNINSDDTNAALFIYE